LQEESPVVVLEEQTGTNPQELQAHEVPEEEEQGEDPSAWITSLVRLSEASPEAF
jgi:hypothetical protein